MEAMGLTMISDFFLISMSNINVLNLKKIV